MDSQTRHPRNYNVPPRTAGLSIFLLLAFYFASITARAAITNYPGHMAMIDNRAGVADAAAKVKRMTWAPFPIAHGRWRWGAARRVSNRRRGRLDQPPTAFNQGIRHRPTAVRRRPATSHPIRATRVERRMQDDGRDLVESVRAVARHHAASWAAMVPNSFVVNDAAEADEEAAYAEMAEAKRRLRAHVREVYGVSIDELARLAAG